MLKVYKKTLAITIGVIVFFTATNLCAQKTQAANVDVHEHGEHSNSSTVSPCCFSDNETTIDANLQIFSIGKVFINNNYYKLGIIPDSLILAITKQTIIPPPELISIKKNCSEDLRLIG